MKKNKLVVIGVFFGKLPAYMPLWLKSCYFNKKIDFKIFTDDLSYKSKNNVEIIKMSIKDFSSLIEKKIKMKICLERPYKSCDYKPIYGIAFEDYIKDYEFWAHCDFDMLFGDICSFLTDDIFDKYDKILPLGHLSFYRNTKDVNNRYKCDGGRNYKDVFSTNKSCFFDEYDGMITKYIINKFPFYDKRIFADISAIYSRFRLAKKDINYNNQVFFWNDGKVKRAYVENDIVKYDEFIYIHFQKRKNMDVHFDDFDTLNSFFVTNTGFYKKNDSDVSLNEIEKYNHYNGFLYEKKELIRFKINKLLSGLKNRMSVKK